MRSIAPDILTQLNKRTGIKVRLLIWFVARNRSTGAPESIGIWNGDDTVSFTIDGVARTYVGGGGFIQLDELKQQTGVLIHKLVAKASPISPEIAAVLRQYNSKFARVQVHMAFFDPETDNVIAAPYRVFKGWIDTLSLKTPAKGGNGVAMINMVGHARILTRMLPVKRSNESQKERLATDRFLENVAITGTLITPWGQAGMASGGGNVNATPQYLIGPFV